jgi:hypothetical protein
VNALANLDKALAALAKAQTLPEVKKIRDVAEAARVRRETSCDCTRGNMGFLEKLKLFRMFSFIYRLDNYTYI